MTNIKNELISHKDLYVWTQINFTFNSNKIEGSHLSKNQIKQIFEENDLTIHSDKMHDLDLIAQMEYDYSVDIV